MDINLKRNIMKIVQEHYPTIEIDESESDAIQLWQKYPESCELIIIEREKIHELIELLQQITEKS